MNTQNTQPKVTPDQVIGELKRTAEPFRVQLMRIVAFLGLIIAGIGSADLTGVMHFLPDEWGRYWLTIGIFAAASKQGVLWLGDLLDNWKLDNSYKLGLFLFPFLLLAFALLTSCGITITEDGCFLGSKKHGDSTYYAGPCVGGDKDGDGSADVDRFRVAWANDAGDNLRLTYWLDSSYRPLLEYQLPNGLWLKWDSKSGVLIGPLPPPAQQALDGDPQPVNVPVVKLPEAPEV